MFCLFFFSHSHEVQKLKVIQGPKFLSKQVSFFPVYLRFLCTQLVELGCWRGTMGLEVRQSLLPSLLCQNSARQPPTTAKGAGKTAQLWALEEEKMSWVNKNHTLPVETLSKRKILINPIYFLTISSQLLLEHCFEIVSLHNCSHKTDLLMLMRSACSLI